MRNNDEIIDFVIELTNAKGLSNNELARRVGTAKSAISRYFNKTREFPLNRIEDFAKALGTTPEEILGFNVDEYRVPDEEHQIDITLTKIKNVSEQLSPQRQSKVLEFAKDQLDEQNNDKILHIKSNDVISEEVEVYGYASAGTGETLIDDVKFTTYYKGKVPNHDFAIQVNGNSMEPMFKDKEIIFVDKTKQINSGQIGIFVVDGESYLKKIFVSDEGIRLVSLNPAYDDLVFDKNHDVEVAGKVIL